MKAPGLLVIVAIALGCSAETRTPTETPAPLTVGVMTFNIRYGEAKERNPADNWPNRKALVFGVVETHGRDFIGMQEALEFQIEQIHAAVPGWSDFGSSRQGDPGCPIFYRTDSWSIDEEDRGTFWLSSTPDVPGSRSWDSSRPRIAIWALFTHKATGRPLYVFNTHFDHRGQRARENSARLLGARVAARARPDVPAIVMGDLNAGEDTPVIETLNASLVHTYRAVHPDAAEVGTSSGFNGRTGSAMIDHIYVTPGTRVLEAAILHDNTDGRYPSDHYPVSAVIRLP
jgi:endonuclease/exonuclease/phosphatase family metal-dependent hydrolase